MIKLTNKRTGQPVYLNPNQVLTVEETNEGVLILLQGDLDVYVTENISRVLEKLDVHLRIRGDK